MQYQESARIIIRSRAWEVKSRNIKNEKNSTRQASVLVLELYLRKEEYGVSRSGQDDANETVHPESKCGQR